MPRPTSRSSHSWISVVLALPMLLIGITAVLMAHSRTLKLADVRVPTRLFPGYAGDARKTQQTTIKAVWEQRNGVSLVGTRTGLYRLANGRMAPVRGLVERDVKVIAGDVETQLAFVGTREGVHRVDADSAALVRKGDVSALTWQAGAGLVAVPVGRAPERSTDGGATWQVISVYDGALRALPPPPVPTTVTLSRLALDIHTGTAFVGRDAEWLFIDVMGGVLVFLVSTGVYLWWLARKRRAQEMRARVPAIATTVRDWTPTATADGVSV